MACCTCIPEYKIGVVEFCGEFQNLAEPGFNCLIPCVNQVAGVLDLSVKQIIVKGETKTRDNVFVVIGVCVQFCPIREKAYDAFYKLTSPDSQINSFVFDSIRSTVPTMLLDDLFENKQHVAQSVQTTLAESMSAFGYIIKDVLLVDIDPDHTVKSAMNEQNAARRLRVAAQEKAEAEKIMAVKRAEGEAESKYLKGLGIAKQRHAIITGLRASVEQFTSETSDLSSKDVMEVILLAQHLDTLKDLSSGGNHGHNTLFVNHMPSSITAIRKEIKELLDSKSL